MEVRRDMFEWLVRVKALDATDPQHQHNRVRNCVTLSKNTARRIESGEWISSLLLILSGSAESVSNAAGARVSRVHEWAAIFRAAAERLQEIKPTVSKPRKVANWEILLPILSSSVMDISEDERDAIIDGDLSVITPLLQRLQDVFYPLSAPNAKPKKLEQNVLPPIKKAASEPEQKHERAPSKIPNPTTTNYEKKPSHQIIDQSPKSSKTKHNPEHSRAPNNPEYASQHANYQSRSYEGPMEMLTIHLAECFNCPPEKANIIVCDPEKRRLMIVDGINGDYLHVQRWFKQLLNEYATLAELLSNHAPDFIIEVLDTMIVGLESRSEDVNNLVIRHLTLLSHELHAKGYGEFVWQWFTTMEKPGEPLGITTIVNFYHTTKSAVMKKMVFPLLVQVGQMHLLHLFEEIISPTFPNPLEHLQFLHDFLTFIGPKEQAHDLMVQSHLSAYLIRVSMAYANSQNGQDIKFEAITMLTDAWLYYPAEAARDEDRSLRVLSQCCLLNVFDHYIGNPTYVEPPKSDTNALAGGVPDLASLLFGHVVFHLLENYEDAELRALIVTNISKILLKPVSQTTVMPGGTLSTYIKQMIIRGHDVNDMSLLFALSKHPNLDIRSAIYLAQLVTKICAEDEVYHQAASMSLVVLLNRFHQQAPFLECVDVLVVKCLERLVNSDDRPTSPFLRYDDPEHNEDLIRITLVLGWLVKVVNMNIGVINHQILHRMKTITSAPLNPQAYAGIRSLLSFFEQNREVKEILGRLQMVRVEGAPDEKQQ